MSNDNLRERKKDATRLTIRSVAFELASQNGLEELTVEAIAKKAGISQRTFFNYFTNRDDALVAENPEVGESLKQAIINCPSSQSLLEAVRDTLNEQIIKPALLHDRQEMIDRYRLIWRYPDLRTRQIAKYNTLEQAITEAVARRRGVGPAADDYSKLLAAISITLMRLSFQSWARQGVELEKVFINHFKQIEKGL